MNLKTLVLLVVTATASPEIEAVKQITDTALAADTTLATNAAFVRRRQRITSALRRWNADDQPTVNVHCWRVFNFSWITGLDKDLYASQTIRNMHFDLREPTQELIRQIGNETHCWCVRRILPGAQATFEGFKTSYPQLAGILHDNALPKFLVIVGVSHRNPTMIIEGLSRAMTDFSNTLLWDEFLKLTSNAGANIYSQAVPDLVDAGNKPFLENEKTQLLYFKHMLARVRAFQCNGKPNRLCSEILNILELSKSIQRLTVSEMSNYWKNNLQSIKL